MQRAKLNWPVFSQRQMHRICLLAVTVLRGRTDQQRKKDETNNLAANPKFESIKSRPGRQLDFWIKQQNDKGIETELSALSRQPKNAPNEDNLGNTGITKGKEKNR